MTLVEYHIHFGMTTMNKWANIHGSVIYEAYNCNELIMYELVGGFTVLSTIIGLSGV